jgi:TatD DNase family protein
VDLHAHLCDPGFDPDRQEVLARAGTKGVEAVVAVGETLADARKNLSLQAAFPGMVLPAAGLYPTHLDLVKAQEMVSWIRRHGDRLAAIGEVGLDHWKVKDPEEREVQKAIFTLFIALSRELDLPLNVHSRSAGRHAIAQLREEGATRVLLHAFDGKASSALPGVEAGYFFSIPPSIIRSPQKQKLARRLPLDCILLETDSPVLGPDPAARNEPANLLIALEAVAELKELSLGRVAEAVVENQQRFFGDRLQILRAIFSVCEP